MKTYNVDSVLKDKDIIRKSIKRVCKRKKKKRKGNNAKYRQAQKILADIDRYVEKVHETVVWTERALEMMETSTPLSEEAYNKMYKPVTCNPWIVKDGPSQKIREIVSVPLFVDQMIHQLLIEACGSMMMKGFYYHSYGSIPGKGAHKGQKRIKRFIKRCNSNKKSSMKYIAKLDITKCYQSIPHWYIEKRLKQKFRGRLLVGLFMLVIGSYHSKVVDGLKIGISIGFSTSQWLCNFCLTPCDFFIKQELGEKHYIRYIDDMVLFGSSKKKLHKTVQLIISKLKSIGLIIKDNWQVYRFDYISRDGSRKGRDLDFLGLRFFRDKTILRKRLALRIRRQSKSIKKSNRITASVARSFMARIGWLKHCNSSNFYRKYVRPCVRIKKLKEVISNDSKLRQKAFCVV